MAEVGSVGLNTPRLPIQNVIDTSLKLDKHPFQKALDVAIESLNNVSKQEILADKMIADYIKGDVGLEEVMIEVEKASLSVSLALTIVNTSVQTFKEILQMPV